MHDIGRRYRTVSCAGGEEAIHEAVDVGQALRRPAAHALWQAPSATSCRRCLWLLTINCTQHQNIS